MKKTVLSFTEIDETVRWLKDNLYHYKNILVIASTYAMSKQILTQLGDGLTPYAEIFRQLDYSRILIMDTRIEARPVGTGEKLRGRLDDLVILYDPASLPANILKEVLT